MGVREREREERERERQRERERVKQGVKGKGSERWGVWGVCASEREREHKMVCECEWTESKDLRSSNLFSSNI